LPDSTPNSAIGPITRQPRLSDRVAQDIIDLIESRQLRPGEMLPPERELGEQLGVSRTVIREAVRVLEAKGMVDVRVGSRTRVAAPDAVTVLEPLRHFVRSGLVGAVAIAEVCEALEVSAAGLAAARASPHDVDVLKAAVDRAAERSDGDAPRGAELAFRRAVVRAANNELFALLYAALADERSSALDPARVDNGADPLRSVLVAIQEHDTGAARRAMRRHVEDGLSARFETT